MSNEPQTKPEQRRREVSRYNSIDVKDIRRRQIIACIRKIIVRSGLEGVTIANIAEELGTSRGVIVYHFQNKEEMLHEVLKSAMHDANQAALRFEQTDSKADISTTISQVVRLATSSSDWWRIYFSYLSQAHVNEIYRDQLAWSDRRYRKALAKTLGTEAQATIVLALMKGLAEQATVDPQLPLDRISSEIEALMRKWLGQDMSSEDDR